MSSTVFRRALAQQDILSEKETKKVNEAITKIDRNLYFVARNMVSPNAAQVQQHRSTRDGFPIPDDSDISRMFKEASTSVRDARNILKSSPELCMGIDIYISGLLSPNDVTRPNLNIICSSRIKLDPIKSALLDVVRTWAKEEYKIDDRLKQWVFKSKFLAGAVPLAIVPLTEIDNIINQNEVGAKKLAIESYEQSAFTNGVYNGGGLLGPGLNSTTMKRQGTVFQMLKMESANTDYPAINNKVVLSDKEVLALRKKTYAMESGDNKTEVKIGEAVLKALGNIYIHDNIEALKNPSIISAAARKSIRNRYSPLAKLAMESGGEQTKPVVNAEGKEIQVGDGKLIYPSRSFNLTEVVSLKPHDIYKNFDHPLVIELPYDSCFPVAPSGLPDHHLGYIVPIDATGNPITAPEQDLAYPDSTDVSIQTTSGIMGTQMLSQIGDASFEGMNNFRHGAAMSTSTQLFSSILEADLKERLKNGLYSGMELDVKLTGVFAEMMFKRALSGMQTQFIFVPSELLTYIAFEYNEYGMGESKLAKHRGLAIIASTVQIANAVAAINNSIQHKKVTIGFDDDEIDAFDTDEKLKQHIVRSQWANALFSSSNSQDQLNHILNTGFHFVYENGNGNFPGTNFDIEYLTREANMIDNEYIDNLNRRLIMLSGVSPEIVDMSQEVEFAQTYITGHMLRAQQAMVEQQVLCANLTKFIQSFSFNSKIIIDQLVDLVQKAKASNDLLNKLDDKDEDLITEFIEAIETTLPEPDTTKLDMQLENLASHEAYIDKVIEYFLSDPALASEEVGEKVGEKLELIRDIFRSAYMRNVIQSNNLVPEHFQFMFAGAGSEDAIDAFMDNETITKRIMEFVVQHEGQIAKLRYQADVDMERINERAQEQAGGDSEGSDNDTSTTTDDSADTQTSSDGDGSEGGAETEDAAAGGTDDPFGDGGDGGEFGFENAPARTNTRGMIRKAVQTKPKSKPNKPRR